MTATATPRESKTALEKREKKQFSYYDFKRLLSHNAVYNFCMGARGLGKTYGAKKLVIKAYLRDKQEFIYLRRFKSELANRQTFFDDIAWEFPNLEFRVMGHTAQVTRNPHDEKPAWETMGYFVALSNAQTRKGVSYHSVTWILFDEFIIEKGALHYLPDEATVLNNFYSTVDRWQDKTRVIFMANAVSIDNPYFLEYRITTKKEFFVAGDGFLCAHFADSNQFASEVQQTRFGAFIKGTAYEEYAVNSVFADAHEHLVARKNADAEYDCTLQTNEGTFSVWRVRGTYPTVYYIQEKRPLKEVIYVTESRFMEADKTYVKFNDVFLQNLRRSFNRACVYFDGPNSRNAFVQIFKRA